ncbi:MAG: ATP-binding protein [Opitutaceae bacterium]
MSIAISGSLLLIALLIAVVSMSRIGRSVEWVTRTYHVIAQVNGLVAALREAEIEQRAYLITGGNEFLVNFRKRAGFVQEAASALGGLYGDSAEQNARLARLRALVEGRLQQLELLVRVREESGVQAVIDAFVEDAARLPAAEMREIAQAAIGAELQQLDLRKARMESELKTSAITIVVCGCIALIMAGHTFFVMRRAIAARLREAELISEKEKAEKSSVEKSAFLANMSHEIRTPLNSVLGFTELLRGTVRTQKERQYVDAISASGTTLLALINDILDLSKIEAGRLELIRQPVSMRMVFDNLRSIFRAQAEERGLKLEFQLGEEVPPALMLDLVRLRQILFNVVGNALKFTRQGSVVVQAESELSPDDETSVTLALRVTDTGIGIARENQQVIFEPFRQVRVDASGSGTGLGLSITRRLTEMLDGVVRLESAPGAGSTFTFRFQCVPISAALPENSDGFVPKENFNALRPSLILIADDVPLNRELISGFLENTHHRVRHAASGREAIRVAMAHHPDIVLMDLRMPEIDGREAFGILRKDRTTSGIPIVAVTASTLLEEDKAVRKVFDGYLRKPFSRSALYRELARHLPAGSSDAEAVAPETAPADDLPSMKNIDPLPSWRGLVAQLRKMELEEWPALSRSMGFRETASFSRHLASLADETECRPLYEYARQLHDEVKSFEIQKQEQTLKNFPNVVAALAETVGRLPR